ncbi:MAG: type II secretion system F family protein [Gammaproteobacteria bacterium]|nr:type II secretion system F family protein [Gammaproteobacteria bacterium]
MSSVDTLQELGISGGVVSPASAALATAVSVSLALMLIVFAYLRVDEEDRSYKDPLPPALRMAWPLVQTIGHYLCRHLPIVLLEHVERRLTRTGVAFLLSAEQFIAINILSTVALTACTAFCLAVLGKLEPVFVLGGGLLGLLLPTVWLNDTRKRRELAVVRSMPVYLDFITMCVEAGLNFTGALAQAMEKAPPGPLRNEFSTVLRDLRAGVSRAQALRRMSERLDIPEVTSFVSAVVQAERMGASLASVLSVQAEQRREERFQRAEKMAMEAPVKLIAPLVMFIFPVTFIVLGFPIAMKFMEQGSF